ncbi:hypothetical protein H5T88_03805 [bacterium]|nr:hypothetical protein [bacterium]
MSTERLTLARFCAFTTILLILPHLSEAKTALQFLQEAPKPKFRQGHTLPPLTRWGWEMPFEVRVELAENWGYALEFGSASPEAVRQLDDPNSIQSRILTLSASNPKRYPLFIILHRPFYDKDFIESLPKETWCVGENGEKIWSPEAPDEVFERAGKLAVEPLKKILEKKAYIAVILNGGEYALTVYGFGGKIWESDGRVLKAKDGKSWFDYISQRKAHQESIFADIIREGVPKALYIYYSNGVLNRNSYPEWWHWCFDYKYMRKVSDLPSSSLYYRDFNSGWSGDNDLLTQFLNAVAQQISLGDALSYNWVNGGWERAHLGESAFSDIEHYMGFLKCCYTAGMIGAVAGYFAYPKGGFGGDLGDEPPHWLKQVMALSYVHALFSYLEDFLRSGDLLPGPNKHRWSKDLPAYEFPTNVPDSRVLVRKHRQRDEWLITAWSTDDKDKEVSVEIPKLGRVNLLARKCGSVYRAKLVKDKPLLRLIDLDGMYPSVYPTKER